MAKECVVSDEYLVGDILEKNHKIYSIPIDGTIGEALCLMKNHKISALPITDKGNNYTGFIDIIDIVSALAIAGVTLEVIASIGNSSIAELVAKEQIPFTRMLVSEIGGIGERNPWVTIQKTELISNLIQLMTSGAGSHRVAVLDGEIVVGIISQLRVVEFLLAKLKEEKGNFQISIVPLEQSAPICCTKDDKVVECFARLHNEEISGMPVVDKDGKLIGSFSSSDIKGCLGSEFLFFEILWRPLSELLDMADEYFKRDRNILYTCEEGGSMESLMTTVVQNHVHRLFVVDKDHKPTRVLSLVNILKQFAK